MNILFIDSHDFIHIALFNENKLLNEEYVYNLKDNSTVLMDIIIKVIGNNIIDLIVVVNGPGSFTGVRLGVTIAKTLAYTKKIPIKVISYLKLMKVMANVPTCTVAFPDSKGFFVAQYKNNSLVENYKYLSNSEFQVLKEETHVTTGIKFNYKLLISYIDTLTEVNPHVVNPIYIKKIDALK